MPGRLARIFFFLLVLTGTGRAQDSLRLDPSLLLILGDSVITVEQDSLVIIAEGQNFRLKKNPYRQSRAFYDSIRVNWSKNWITRELHDLFFRTPSERPHRGEEIPSEAYYSTFKGKRIAQIRCIKVPIYEGSVLDTTLTARSGFGRLVNRLFFDTRDPVILRTLLVETGDLLDPFRVADSERLLRSLSFIEDAKIYAQSPPGRPDEVILTVVTKDRFRYGVDADISGLTEWSLSVGNRSLFGSGHRLNGVLDYIHNQEINSNGISLNYSSPPLGRQWFATIDAFWSRRDDLRGQGITIARAFFAPQVKWGGAATILSQEKLEFAAISPDSVGQAMIRLNRQDIWLARSFILPGEEGRSNLAIAIRYLHNNYAQRPLLSDQLNAPFHDRRSWLGSLIFRRQKFLKTRQLLTFGISEDVPLGIQAALTFGADRAEFHSGPYAACSLSASRFFPGLGFFSLSGRYGGFSREGKLQDAILQAAFQYFSPAIPAGRWANRNFLSLQLRQRIHSEIPLWFDLEDQSLRHFNGPPLRGERILSGNIDHVWFSPWFFYGFRFAPFAFADFGLIQESRSSTELDDAWYGIGLGMRIRNESIALNSLELRLSWFPEIPGERDALFLNIQLSRPLVFQSLPSFKPQLSF
jgi:hypothetical protein